MGLIFADFLSLTYFVLCLICLLLCWNVMVMDRVSVSVSVYPKDKLFGW